MFGIWKKSSRPATIKEYWQQRYFRDKDGYEEMLAKDQWELWDRLILVEGYAEDPLLFAIAILSGSDNIALANAYLHRTMEIIDRIAREDKLHSERCERRFPYNQGSVRRTKVYAEGLLGKPFDTKTLLLASRDFEKYCIQAHGDENAWDTQIQYYYINAIHLALLGGDLSRAKTLLENPYRKLSGHLEHVGLLRDLIRLNEGQLTEDQQTVFIDRFNKFFDEFRNPLWEQPKDYFRESIGRIDLTLLREKYIQHIGGEIDWRRVIEEFSR